MRMRAAHAAALLLGVACAAPLRPAPRPPPIPLSPAGPHREPEIAGVVHVVRQGETMYRIARTYGMDPGDLMETNGIVDPRTIEIGTELFVPGAAAVLEVPPAESVASAKPLSTPTTTPTPTPTSTTTSTPARPAGGAPAVLSWPLQGVLYARFGTRGGQRHDGIDIAAPEGTNIKAAADGKVIYAGEQPGYGSIVLLRHAGGLVTLYAHASKLLVREGQSVERGDPVARGGQTGKTTGPHLHFEVRDGTRPRNPLLYLR